MMLRELDAFEACWLDLKDIYPTNGQDNMLIAHAMGQLVDLLEKPAQVEQDLPNHLKDLFRRLALAYFQGYFPNGSQQDIAVKAPRPVALPNPRCDLRQRHEISAAVSQVKALAQKTQARSRQGRGQASAVPMSEMETLIIEFPAHWQPA
jgi:hypothetical protein